MNAKRLFPVLFVVVFVVSACGAGSTAAASESTSIISQPATIAPTATYTPSPTQTPVPPTATATQPDSEVVSVLKENGFVRNSVNDCGLACTTYENGSAEIRVVVYDNGTVTYHYNITKPKVQGDVMEILLLRLYGKNAVPLFLVLATKSITAKSLQSATIDGYKFSAEATLPYNAIPATVNLEVAPS